MNAVGNVGNFIVNNQQVIELAVIIIIAFLVIVFAIKSIVNARRKKDILAQISDTVSEINSAVTSMGNKGKEVIYIDNRSARDIPTKENEATVPMNNDPAEEVLEPDEVTFVKDEIESENKENHKKYFDRNCGVDKNGNKYTEEELNRQIRE